MSVSDARDCPICGDRPRGPGFPYATEFADTRYRYLACGGCATVYVDPVPDQAAFRAMYAKSEYHDAHYEGIDPQGYVDSLEFLAKYVPAGASILDYGCGTGEFLAACTARGFRPTGVDFDADVAQAAGVRGECAAYSVLEFDAAVADATFDVLHMGDVLEHLPAPLEDTERLLRRLRPDGLLYVEGPLETNPSLVYWAARAFGALKRRLRPRFLASHPPHHLLLTDAASQQRFFERLHPAMRLVAWRVEETGWPYAEGGRLKRSIAACARAMGGRSFFGVTFGNRFKAILARRSDGRDA